MEPQVGMESQVTTSQVRTVDPVTVEVQVEVPWERVQKGLDDTFTKLQRQARIKGFRPGKVPRSVLSRLFSKDVEAEVVQSIVEESVVAAVKEHELPVVSNPTMEKRPEITEGQPLSFTVMFEVRPKVETLVLDLALNRPPVKVDESEVDSEIQRLRERQAIVRPLETERPAQKGDVLTTEYTVEIEGAMRDDLKGEERTVQLGVGRLLEEIDTALVGAKAGDTVEVLVQRPETDRNPELAGKKVVFRVKVHDVRERVLPEIDDELAKDVGEFETLADLRASIRGRLEEAAKRRSEEALREQAVEKLVEANPIPVPPSLLEQQLRSMLQDVMQVMKMIGQQFELTDERFAEMRTRAEIKVRAGLLLGELSRQASISVKPEEVEARLAEMAEKSGKHIAKIKAEYAGEKREGLETQILEEKLIRHLLDGARISDEPAAEAAPASP